MLPRKFNSKNHSKTPALRGWRIRILSGVAAAAVLAAVISSGGLLQLGQQLALLSVGLMQPEGGVQALSERLERFPAQGGNNTASEGPSSTQGTYPIGGGNEIIGETSEPDGVIPEEAGDGGKAIEEAISYSNNLVAGIPVKNNSVKTIDIAAQLAIMPELNLSDTSEPQVLIIHTHTTEAYMTYYAGYYNAADIARSFDNSMNIMRVGAELASSLRAAGIGVIHDVTVFDNPKYTGAYDRSAARITELLEKYPTIRVVLDLHRDAINRSNTVKCKPTTMVNNRKAAQMMIIAGVTTTDAVPHPEWEQNLRFALQLQKALHDEYPGLMRPLSLVNSRYNEHLTRGSLLIEVGGDVNTVSEAVYSAQLLGTTLVKVLNSLK